MKFRFASVKVCLYMWSNITHHNRSDSLRSLQFIPYPCIFFALLHLHIFALCVCMAFCMYVYVCMYMYVCLSASMPKYKKVRNIWEQCIIWNNWFDMKEKRQGLYDRPRHPIRSFLILNSVEKIFRTFNSEIWHYQH